MSWEPVDNAKMVNTVNVPSDEMVHPCGLNVYWVILSVRQYGYFLSVDVLSSSLKCPSLLLGFEYSKTYEPPRGKTNNVVSEQVRNKPTCTSTEKS